ncbi:hypothetical protein COLO4_05323 [Corchorus olitorius]|uniref:Uncharacterized protein n=1 Tax=Corchorus olitorius TaxID=93759 RepID=A0A1R3KRD9_9ROSI|nr:hypothetical protein COLO4_05323 [Corchorus olitorius]
MLDECSPLRIWRAFSVSHSASVLHLRSAIFLLSRGAFSSPRDLRFALGECSPLGTHSAGVLRLALDEGSPLRIRRPFYICDRRSSSSHGEHFPFLGDLRDRRAFSTWHSLGGSSPLGARRALSFSSHEEHSPLLADLRLAIDDRSPLTGSILLSL